MCTWPIWPITTASGMPLTEALPAAGQFKTPSLRVSQAPHEKHPARPLQQTCRIKKYRSRGKINRTRYKKSPRQNYPPLLGYKID